MKIYHKATQVNSSGGVSALCFHKPKAINLARASWTLRDDQVTCKKCQRLINSVAMG